MEYRVAVVGNGGREFELGRQLGLSDDVKSVYFLNGNAGTEQLPKGQNVDIQPTAIKEIVSFAEDKRIDLTVVGPEAPLAFGLVDQLKAKGIRAFGPTAQAAMLESSKIWSARFMSRHGIPKPPSSEHTSYNRASQTLIHLDPRDQVIKKDGLASGKSAFLPETSQEADSVLQDLFSDRNWQEPILIQRRYHGAEISAQAICDGKYFTRLPYSQDYKRLLEGDTGPMTGGVGTYAPVPETILSQSQAGKIEDIIERTIAGMAKEGRPYKGVLYVGIMLAEELGGEPVVIEYNARFGDPEAQAVLALMPQGRCSLFDRLMSATEGIVVGQDLPSNLGSVALTTCLAAPGYPEDTITGQVIHGLDNNYDNAIIQHGRTRRDGKDIKVAGGRALYVTALGDNINEAAISSQQAISQISFDGMQYRDDIGYQALESLQ